MDTHEKANIIEELESLIKEFRSYKRLYSQSRLTPAQERYLESLRFKLQRRIGKVKSLVVQLTDSQYASELNYKFDFWSEAVRLGGYTPRTIESIDHCIQACNEAIGKVNELNIERKNLEEGKIVNEEPPKDATELPVHLFDAMQFHPKVIEASRELFKDGHYRDAIYRAFVEVNNFVKDKSNKQLDGKRLMSTVFSLDNPIIKLNELKNQTDKDEQEGFMFLFMGAMEGIRNPKAHLNIIQKDPYRTLEYLALASLLMKIAEEGKAVKTGPPRTKWDWERFLKDINIRCESEVIDLVVKLYEFTRSNADRISWGTGFQDGSFTFGKLGFSGMNSIFSVYSCGWVYINFGSMKEKNLPNKILESFRANLNKIPNVNFPKEVVTGSKYPRLNEKLITNPNNLKLFQDAILSLCQQLENPKE